MKIYKIIVNFLRNQIIIPKIELVKDDYNSIEFEFDFDIEDGKKVFELKKPNGKVFVREIIDNKITLVDYDENQNIIPLINQQGIYEFEISTYNENGKLTAHQIGTFEARDEVVDLEDDVIDKDVRLPILDQLITDVETSTNKAEEMADYAKEQGDYAKKVMEGFEVTETDPTVPEHVKNITEEDIAKWNQGGDAEYTAEDIKFADGETFQQKYDSGELKGEQGPQGPQGVQGPQGAIGDKGDKGDKGDTGATGPQGPQGEQGPKGDTGATGPQGEQGPKGDTGSQGPKGDTGDDGKTPIKGTDYFTEADKQELVNLVLAEIPSAEGVGY